MQRILVVNPNTTRSVTDMVTATCRKAHPQVQWDGVSAGFGAAYIASEAAYAIAAHAVLDAFATYYADHDAVLIACFGDPGLLAPREISGVPVIGLAQASFVAAGRQGKFAVVTGGKAWEPMLRRLRAPTNSTHCRAGWLDPRGGRAARWSAHQARLRSRWCIRVFALAGKWSRAAAQ